MIKRFAFRALIVALLTTIAGGCSDPYKLNETAELKSFVIESISNPDVTFGHPEIEDGMVLLPLIKGRYDFPLTISASVVTGSESQKILNVDFTQPIEFKSIGEVKEFYVSSESGLPKRYTINIVKLPDADDNDVELFTINQGSVIPSTITLVSEASIEGSGSAGRIRVKVEKGVYPMTVSFVPTVTVSLGATCSLAKNERISFESMDDTVRVTVKSQSGIEKIWRVYLENNTPQLSNSDFETWITSTEGNFLNPFNWATANNMMVQGTAKETDLDPTKRTVAKMTTKKVTIVTQIAAGSVFLGYFKLNMSQINNPPMMTYQGIPFTGKPKALKVDVKYQPGEKYEQAVGGKFVELPGKDQGKVLVELLRFDGPHKEYEYHGSEITKNVEVLGDGVIAIDSTNDKWERVTVPIIYDSESKQPNYISIMFSSGYLGDKFIGAAGSTLYIDNVELVY